MINILYAARKSEDLLKAAPITAAAVNHAGGSVGAGGHTVGGGTEKVKFGYIRTMLIGRVYAKGGRTRARPFTYVAVLLNVFRVKYVIPYARGRRTRARKFRVGVCWQSRRRPRVSYGRDDSGSIFPSPTPPSADRPKFTTSTRAKPNRICRGSPHEFREKKKCCVWVIMAARVPVTTVQ